MAVCEVIFKEVGDVARICINKQDGDVALRNRRTGFVPPKSETNFILIDESIVNIDSLRSLSDI